MAQAALPATRYVSRFAFRALHHRNGPRQIVYAVCNSVVVAEIELGQITVKMFAAYMVVCAESRRASKSKTRPQLYCYARRRAHTRLRHDPPFRDGRISFRRASSRQPCQSSARTSCPHSRTRSGEAFGRSRSECDANARGHRAPQVNARCLSHAADVLRLALPKMFVLFLAPDVRGIGFNIFSGAAHNRELVIAHCFAQTMRNKPRRLKCDAQSPVKLVCRHALLAGTH